MFLKIPVILTKRPNFFLAPFRNLRSYIIINQQILRPFFGRFWQKLAAVRPPTFLRGRFWVILQYFRPAGNSAPHCNMIISKTCSLSLAMYCLQSADHSLKVINIFLIINACAVPCWRCARSWGCVCSPSPPPAGRRGSPSPPQGCLTKGLGSVLTKISHTGSGNRNRNILKEGCQCVEYR